ncbi:hypothetical protein [Streptomyces decoyicus]|uniref:hypothetical protein n=1 Tax=Streptomyces decoyicus TaxID=249567 RepID=UPI00069F28FD|nr:hypothetical protein [Streptomyces decoyicus]KOG42237.1 hypothetical protein ADK74_16660 [Streptomyces decoyicus]QZY13969.1 hypothetical protein K7C20_00780 [Streptomyces decoyicus]
MRRGDTSEPGAGGPSTEDLAGTRQHMGSAAPEPPAEAPPTFPGEATAADRGVSTSAGEGRDASSERNREAEVQEPDAPLLGPEQEEFRSRWQRIQSEFVDDPREAVGAADTLVAEVMQALATTFSEHKQGLEGQWHRGEEVATEELRVALQRYRSFFNRLLNT